MRETKQEQRAAVDSDSPDRGQVAPVRASDPARFPTFFTAIVVLGFGLFYGVSTSSYLSAFSSVSESFLFVPDIFFNVVVALSVVGTAGIIVILTLWGKLPAFSLSYWWPIGLLIVVNLAVMLGFFRFLPAEMQLLVPGLAFGIASVMLRLVWLEFFACQKPSIVIYQLALGMFIGAFLSPLISSFSAQVQVIASCVLLAGVGLCARYARGAVVTFMSVPSVAPLQGPAMRLRSKEALLSIGDALVAFWVLEAVVGLLNSFMLAGQIDFAGSGSVSSFARLVAILVFCLFAFVIRRLPQASTFGRIVMPILAAMLVFLPFLSEGYSLFFNIMLLGCYSFVSLLITYFAVEAAYTYRISPYILMGVAMMGTRLCLAIALIVGYSMGVARTSVFGDREDTLYFLIVIVVVIYVLSMTAVFLSRGRRRRNEDRRWFGEGEKSAEPQKSSLAEEERQVEGKAEASGDIDRALETRCEILAAEKGLTEREAEIVVLLARGRTKVHIAKSLFVTENTVRSHVRNIYTKLDVHTRQELIDLIEDAGSQ